VEPELRPDDRTALAWALGTRSPSGLALAARLQRGETALTGDDLVVVRREWDAAGRPVHEPHVHRTVVELADGTAVTGVSFRTGDPYGRDSAPTFGLYLDAKWDPPWTHELVAWPDFGVPADPDAIRVPLQRLLARARSGEVVEVGCVGGHGRTGTALACLAVLSGVSPAQAVDWVRTHYCPDAVETDAQRTFVERFEA
jgi:hypothetical protein